MMTVEGLLTNDDLATWLGVSVETVRTWRKTGTGPPGFKVGRHVRYEPADVRRWIDAQKAAAMDAAPPEGTTGPQAVSTAGDRGGVHGRP
jgi:predicted DNA-binding transcriptional regulator AlpA